MEEDWEILELTGPFSAFCVHQPTGGLVYSLGTVIVIWDVISDKKINLRCHSSRVTSLTFSTDNEYFISADLSSQPLLCLWRWRSLEQISAKWLPFKPRSSPITSIFTAFIHKKILVCEIEEDGGYRISLFEHSENSLNLKTVEDLELNETCIGIAMLNDQLNFACLEASCLKLWSLDSCTINKRFHFKSKVHSMEYCRSQGVFALLLENKSILVMNQSGKTLALISNEAYNFTAMVASSDYLYISSFEGSVVIYNLRSFSLFKELPATHSSPIRGIRVNTGNLIYVLFEDATVQVLNLVEGQVTNQSSGHCLPINSAAWAEKLNFYSSSDEGCLYVWRYIGKGWNMQAMDVSAGKGLISALATHPSHRVLACGFSSGIIKIFQTGEKPKFLNAIQFENSPISYLEYTHCGKFLAIVHENGYACVVNSKFENVVELEQSKNKANLNLAVHEVFSSNGMILITASMREDYLVNLMIFRIVHDNLEKIDEKSWEIDGNCTGLKFHCSGNYLFVASDAGGIYIFAIDSCEVCGVILTEKSIIGCVLDPSGLYVGTFAESVPGLHSTFVLYEIGTGKKASELGRLDNISPHSCKWNKDGKYLIMGGQSGLLTVWRLPKVLISTIHDMLASLQTNPYLWQDFPIDLPNKQIFVDPGLKKTKEIIVMPETSHKKERGAFVDSVVVLVRKPEKLTKERASSKPPVRVSKISIPDHNSSKSISRSDTPGSAAKDFRPVVKQSINDFYFKKNVSNHAPKSQTGKAPVIVKSTLIGTSKSIESIDVECSAPNKNPAHRLYEKAESYTSEFSVNRFR